MKLLNFKTFAVDVKCDHCKKKESIPNVNGFFATLSETIKRMAKKGWKSGKVKDLCEECK